jgi:hypothetical protein
MSFQESQTEANNLINDKFWPAEDVLFRRVEQEAVLLHLPSGTYYGLSITSILFWEAIQNQQPLEPVVDQILNEYNVERSQVLNELQLLLQILLDNGLIKRHTA